MTAGTIAVIGLGQMGAGIAASLARAGRTVLGVDPVAAPQLPGVHPVSQEEAFARAEVLLLSLPGTEQVRQVLTGDSGLCTTDSKPRLVIDASTCHPDSTRELATQLTQAGHLLVDAPVSGGPSGAQEGQLTAFLGCPPEHLARVLEELEPVTGRVSHVGEVGAGHTAKLVNNLLVGTHLAITGEAWRMAERAGIDPERLFAAVNHGSGRSAVTEINLPRWVLSNSYDSGFPVHLMARDVALATRVAREAGDEVPLAETATATWDRLLHAAGPNADFNRMVTTS